MCTLEPAHNLPTSTAAMTSFPCLLLFNIITINTNAITNNYVHAQWVFTISHSCSFELNANTLEHILFTSWNDWSFLVIEMLNFTIFGSDPNSADLLFHRIFIWQISVVCSITTQ